MQGFVAQIPLRFTARTPKPLYPKQLKHLGDHLRAKRIDLGLLQKEVAVRIGVHTASVTNWELGDTAPATAFYPTIITFLGYNPLPLSDTPGGAIRRARIAKGWSQAELAARAGVDPASVMRVEANTKGTARRVSTAIRRALDLDQ